MSFPALRSGRETFGITAVIAGPATAVFDLANVLLVGNDLTPTTGAAPTATLDLATVTLTGQQLEVAAVTAPPTPAVFSITGSYNGLTFGPGGQVHLADCAGVDDMPNLRVSDLDQPGEGMIPGRDFLAARALTFEWLMLADTYADYIALRTAVQKACGPQELLELPLTINNSNRELRCRPRKLSIPRRFDAFELNGSAFVEFAASDPWWYDAADTVVDFTLGSTTASFFPLPPLRLVSSEVFGDATVLNDGDTVAWPVWTVTGPGSALVLRNFTTGKTLTLTTGLSDGETVTIDTNAGEKTVVRNDGTNLFGAIGASSLWPLAAGGNSVRVEFTGATAASKVSLRMRRRWLAGV